MLGGLAAIFAVGIGLLLRQPVLAVAGVPAPAAAPPSRRAEKRARLAAEAAAAALPNVATPPVAAPVPAPAPAAVSLLEQVSQDVSMDVNALKDMLLRIELRRQAGTISDDEYARERRQAEQLLRELVQS